MKEFRYGILFQSGTDHAQSADRGGTAVTDIRCTGYIVIVDPLSVCTCHDAFGTQHIAIGIGISEGFECCPDLVHGVLSCRLGTPALKDLICMMMVMLMFVMVVMMMLMFIMIMLMMVFMLIVVMIMMVFMLIVVMLMMVFMLIVVVIMMFMFVMVMMMVMFMIISSSFLKKCFQLIIEGIPL